MKMRLVRIDLVQQAEPWFTRLLISSQHVLTNYSLLMLCMGEGATRNGEPSSAE